MGLIYKIIIIKTDLILKPTNKNINKYSNMLAFCFWTNKSSADVFLTTCSRSGPRCFGRSCKDDKRGPARQNKNSTSEDSRALMLQRSSEMKQNMDRSRIRGVSKKTAGTAEQKQIKATKRISLFVNCNHSYKYLFLYTLIWKNELTDSLHKAC